MKRTNTTQQGLAGIIIVIIIAAVLAGGYYLWSTGKLADMGIHIPGMTSVKELPPLTSLVGSEWSWQKTEYADATIPIEEAPWGNKFILRFEEENRLTSLTDCNNLLGGYIINDQSITITPFVGTKKFCEGSKEAVYRNALESASAFSFTNDELRITVSDIEGTMIFARRVPTE